MRRSITENIITPIPPLKKSQSPYNITREGKSPFQLGRHHTYPCIPLLCNDTVIGLSENNPIKDVSNDAVYASGSI